MSENVRKLIFILIQGLVIYTSPASADNAGSTPEPVVKTNQTAACVNVDTPVEKASCPVTTNRFDRVHDHLFLRIQRPVSGFDRFFVKKDEEPIPVPFSRFRLGTFLQIEESHDEISTTFKSDFEADLYLPNLEARSSLFINSFRSDELPGLDPTERKKSLNLGLQRIFDAIDLHTRVGVRWRNGPVGIGKIEWRPKYSLGKTTIYPRQRVFYETDEGFGEVTSLTLNRWLGKKNFARLVSAGRWTEETVGVEWEQTLMLVHVMSLIEKNKTADLVDHDDVAKGFGLRFSSFGHKSTDEGFIDRHRVTLIYRQPLYRNWFFFQIAPGIEWRNEDEWSAIPSIQIGFDTLFWEVSRQ